MEDNTARRRPQDDAPRAPARGRGEEDDERVGTTPERPRLLPSSSSSSNEALCFFGNEDELISRMVDELDVAEVEAIRSIQRYGIRRVEASLLKTIESPGVRVPAAWFYSTLNRCLEWTAKEVELYAERHGGSSATSSRLDGIEAEWGRWAEYLIRGDYPPDFGAWTEANREHYQAALNDVRQRIVTESPDDYAERIGRIGGADGQR